MALVDPLLGFMQAYRSGGGRDADCRGQRSGKSECCGVTVTWAEKARAGLGCDAVVGYCFVFFVVFVINWSQEKAILNEMQKFQTSAKKSFVDLAVFELTR